MRNRLHKSNPLYIPFVVMGVFLGIMVCGPLLTRAYAPATAITITNNSNREIKHVFLSAPDQNNWGPDQLGSSVIAPNGGSVTLGNVSCDGPSIKVIAEDQEGCFTYQVVSCSENASWTITNESARDCGN